MKAGPCTVCAHEKRDELERDLASGVSQRVVAKWFGISFSAVGRHARNHLPGRLAERLKAHAEEGHGIASRSVLDRLREIHGETWALAKSLQGKKDTETRLRVIQRLERQLELEARLLGEIDGGASVVVNLSASTEWASVRAVILETLDAFPEARLAVAFALQAASEAPPDGR